MENLQTTASAELLTARLASLIDAGRLGAARPLLSAVRRLSGPSSRLAELAARLAMREGRLDLAQTELDEAVAQAPEHIGLRKCRADLRMQMNDKEGAATDAAEAVILDSSDPAAKAVPGILMLELGRSEDAIACLGEAVAADPTNPHYREGLAAAQQAVGRRRWGPCDAEHRHRRGTRVGSAAQRRDSVIGAPPRLHHGRTTCRRGLYRGHR